MSFLSDNPLTAFSRGFFSPFRSLGFLRKHPALLRFVAIPFLINLVVFSGVVYLGMAFFNDTVVRMIPGGEAWYWAILTYLVWFLAVLVTSVLVFFVFTLVGNLIASPFNDILSERVEGIVAGQSHEGAFSLRLFFPEAKRALALEFKKIAVFLGGMALLLTLNLIPGLGQILYAVASFLFTLFFLVVEYLGFVLGRKGWSFKEQRRYIFARKFLMLGFGSGVFCLLIIPFVQLLCIPLAVIAATILWCEK
jgi:CysZ protein